MKGPLEVHHHLVGRDIPHEILRLARGIPSAEHLADALAVPANRCITVWPYLASAGKTTVLIAVLCPMSSTPDLVALRRAALVRSLTPARSDRVSAETDYVASHLSPLLLPPEVVVLASSEIATLGDTPVYTATGDGGTALRLSAADLLRVTGARIVTTTVPVAAVPVERPRTTIVLPADSGRRTTDQLPRRQATAGR